MAQMEGWHNMAVMSWHGMYAYGEISMFLSWRCPVFVSYRLRRREGNENARVPRLVRGHGIVGHILRHAGEKRNQYLPWHRNLAAALDDKPWRGGNVAITAMKKYFIYHRIVGGVTRR